MAITLTRDFYIPTAEGVRKVEDGSAVVYFWEEAGVPKAMAFAGKSAKPAWRFRFRSEASRQEYADKFFANAKAVAALKAERKASVAATKASINAVTDMPVGTVLVSSGGYEQTNVSFYKVVGHFGRMGVKLVKIGAKTSDESTAGSMSCYLLANPDSVIGEEFTARATSKDSVSGKGFWSDRAYKWDGHPQYCSWYA